MSSFSKRFISEGLGEVGDYRVVARYDRRNGDSYVQVAGRQRRSRDGLLGAGCEGHRREITARHRVDRIAGVEAEITQGRCAGRTRMKPVFVATPPQWPHAHLRPRSEQEAAKLMTVAPDRLVFVFGSNLAGKHIGGAAATAMKFFGAKFGTGLGLQGQSFALPTMGRELEQLPLASVQQYVQAFIAIAEINSIVEPFTFYVTAIGTGIAGFTAEQIAPMFANAPSNCLLPPEWAAFVSSTPDLKDS